uniref:ATP-binding protein n=1 Tax=Algoriphagus sp. TaxID=1872435 RepID=UPI0040482065
MNNNLSGKRLLILGGNPETEALVKYANELGVHTIVIDPNPNSPAKKSAIESYDVEVMNPEALLEKAKLLDLDGILVGVADILVPSYYNLCMALDFPCYATLDSIDVFTTKNGFRNRCEKYGIGVIPYYHVEKEFNDSDISEISFPILVKPVDNGAGVGMNVSTNSSELKEHIDIAISNSKRKEYLVEKYMDCDDMLVYYTISDGVPYLSAAADRYTTKAQNVGSPVCSLARYPSKYLDLYIREIHYKVVNLIVDTGVKNGVLNIQFFVDNDCFYAYDPGFRLQGEAPHLYLNKINDFDNRKMLINFALTSSTQEPDIILKNDAFFRGNFGGTLWVLLKEGQIGKIEGLDEIKLLSANFQIIQRLYVGDQVSKEMIGTERQVFGRFYIVSDSQSELVENIKFIQNTLKISNINSEEMVLEIFDIDKIKL